MSRENINFKILFFMVILKKYILFWDCLAGMKKGNKLLSQLKRGEKDKRKI